MAVVMAISLPSSEPSMAASAVNNRPRAASRSAKEANRSAPISWKWLGQASSMRVDSMSSTKVAIADASGPDQRTRSARYSSSPMSARHAPWMIGTRTGCARMAGASRPK
jgi:hypothetical protein